MISLLPTSLCGDWISKNSSYEQGLCDEIGWIKDTNRYFDAKKNNFKIEIKKGTSIWLDLVRYSEILLKQGEGDTLTAFFIPAKDKSRITDIYFVETDAIIKFLNITDELAYQLLAIKNNLPRQLNAQANLTKRDIEMISLFHHKF